MNGKVKSPAAVIIFSIITCGIYALVWIYSFAKDLKNYLGSEDIKPGLDLLLCMVCFPYMFYWTYKYGKCISEAQKKAGIPESNDEILYLVLAIFGLFIVDMAIMQSKVNEIWSKQ